MTQHYVYGKMLEGTLAPRALREVLAQGRDAFARIREVPARDIVDLLERVGRSWSRPDYGPRREVLDRLPCPLGFSRQMVEKGLDELTRLLSRHTLMTKLRHELGRPEVLDRWVWQPGYQGYVKAAPLGVVAHISPENVFLGAADSLVHGLLTKNANVLKVSGVDPCFPICFARSVQEQDREGVVSGSLAVLSFPGGDRPLEEEIKAAVDGLVVWGDEETVTAWSEGLPAGVRLVEYGPRFSFALLTRAALEEHGAKTCASLVALDTVMWEQRACASLQVLFLERPRKEEADDFLEALQTELEELSTTLPQGPLTMDEKIEILQEREVAGFEEMLGGTRAFFPAGSDRWTVLWRESFQAPLGSPLNRCLVVIPYTDLDQVVNGLAPRRRHLQTAGIGGTASQIRELANRAIQAGATRITELGQMHRAKHGAPRDGTFQLARLIRWVTIESVAERFDAGRRLHPGRVGQKSDRLLALVEYVRERSPWYERRYRDIVFEKREDMPRLPLLKAEELRKGTPPISQDLLTGPLEGAYVFASGGSTGAPKFSLYSYEEWEDVTDILAAIYQVAGITAGDTVANLFMAGNLWTSFMAASQALEKLGCVTLPIAGNAEIDRIMGYLELFRPSVLLGLPSILIQIAETAKARGLSLQIRRILYGGEHLSGDAAAFLRRVLGAELVLSAGYASVDAGPIGYQLPHQTAGTHRLLYDYQYLEFVDPLTQQPVAHGEVGEIVTTCLRRRLMPLIRYRTGDLGRWLHAPGSGSEPPEFELKGRVGDRLRVGTADVYPDDISRALDGLEGVSHLFQMVVEPVGGKDRLTVVAERTGEIMPGLEEQLRQAILASSPELSQAVRERWLGQLVVELVPSGSLPRVARTGKIRKIVDRRT
ncbi:MAG: AMP-binding protein [Armatimonadetes bacterium]|nr:AMP-binding protein [Armatimonadota bacterium]